VHTSAYNIKLRLFTIQPSFCRVVVPTGRELDSLPQAQLNQRGAEEGTCSDAPVCDSCVIEERTNQAKAKFFCETCNMKFCVTHDQVGGIYWLYAVIVMAICISAY